jgi:uncharacterized membrane protein
MPSTRLEAFSDAVLAIAITLLVLDLKVPSPGQGGHTLAWNLAREWPAYAAYVLSFLVIGIMWVNHHSLFAQVERVDRPLLFTNLLLLIGIAVLPFPTALFAEYVNRGGTDSHVAAAVYSVTMVFIAIWWQVLWRSIFRERLQQQDLMASDEMRRATRRFALGLIVYLVTVGIAWISAPLTLAVHFVIAIYYMFEWVPQGASSD